MPADAWVPWSHTRHCGQLRGPDLAAPHSSTTLRARPPGRHVVDQRDARGKALSDGLAATSTAKHGHAGRARGCPGSLRREPWSLGEFHSQPERRRGSTLPVEPAQRAGVAGTHEIDRNSGGLRHPAQRLVAFGLRADPALRLARDHCTDRSLRRAPEWILQPHLDRLDGSSADRR